MPELDIRIDVTDQAAITVLDTTVSETIAAGLISLSGWSLRTTSLQSGQSSEGAVNAPAAGATVLTLAMPQGQWTLSWEVEVSGTVGAPEVNNFQLLAGAIVLLNSLNGNTAGTPYPQSPITVSIPAGGANLTIKTINASTVGSVYSASISATPVGAVAVAEITSGGNPVAEISLPVGGVDTQYFGGGGIVLRSDLTLSVLSGSFRGAIYARLM